MRRRDFIKVVAWSAIIWPITARAQETRHIGVLGLTIPQPLLAGADEVIE